MYFVAVLNVGVIFLFSFTVTVLDKIAGSVLSKAFKIFECLKTLSNFCRLFVLKDDMVVVANAVMSDADFSVNDGLYFTVVPNTRKSVSGSTITGVIEATLYCLRLLTIVVFVVSVKVSPVFGFMEM